MDRGAWWATVHGVAKGSDVTYSALKPPQLSPRRTQGSQPWRQPGSGCNSVGVGMLETQQATALGAGEWFLREVTGP